MKTLKYFVLLVLFLNIITSCTNDSNEDDQLYSIGEVVAEGGEDGTNPEENKGG